MLELLPENDGNILGLRARGNVSLDDYRKTLFPRLEAVIKDWGKARLVLYLDEDFQGFNLQALLGNTSSSNRLENLEKIALVGVSAMLNMQIRLASVWLDGKVKTFAREELPQAWDWVRT